MNAVLARAGSVSKRESISLRHELDVPRELAVADNDLCSFLMNMLDNAIETCLKVPESERWIELSLRIKGNSLVVSCRNAKSKETIPQTNSRLQTSKTSKTSKDLHGYGKSAMEDVVKKYDSKLNIEFDPSVFSVKTILRLQKRTTRPHTKKNSRGSELKAGKHTLKKKRPPDAVYTLVTLRDGPCHQLQRNSSTDV